MRRMCTYVYCVQAQEVRLHMICRQVLAQLPVPNFQPTQDQEDARCHGCQRRSLQANLRRHRAIEAWSLSLQAYPASVAIATGRCEMSWLSTTQSPGESSQTQSDRSVVALASSIPCKCCHSHGKMRDVMAVNDAVSMRIHGRVGGRPRPMVLAHALVGFQAKYAQGGSGRAVLALLICRGGRCPLEVLRELAVRTLQ